MASAADPALAKRVVSALILGAIALVAIVTGGWVFAVLVAIGVIVLGWEWGSICRLRWNERSGWLAGGLASVAGIGSVLFLMLEQGHAALITLVVGAGLGAVAAFDVKARAGWLAGGVLYVGLAPFALVWLRNLPDVGMTAVLWVIAVVWTTDIAAYFVGRSIGGARLAPRISPGKTWAGLWGGIAGAGVTATVIAVFVGSERLVLAVCLGAAMAAVAQIGDLFESGLKRTVGIKDSGSIIPGHGGALDRLDGLLFAAPAAALLTWLIGPDAMPWS